MRKKPSPALARLLLVLALLGLWEIFTRLSSVSAILIAPPSAIFWQMVQILTRTSNVPDFYVNAGVTIGEILIAYGLAAVFGVLTGLAVASSKVIGDAFEPILLVLYAVPKIILYPVFVLTIGTGPATKIVFGVFVGIFVIIFNTAAGLRQVEPNYVRLGHSLGFGKANIFFKVELPAAAQTILAGLRLGFGYTIIGVLTGELLLVNAGLGYLIDWASVNYYTAQLYALIVVTLAVGVVANYIVGRFERRWVR
ncbi:MAG TPA: ABC transporter permease [Stellaceae bacterium]|jgi:NitT/TauT family transport system permease protein|nr:ABC transporter permease [Stellaceae bacterium]